MADYNIDLQYHPGKTNVVPDALSRKFDGYEMIQLTTQKELLTEMMKLDLMVIRRSSGKGLLMTLQIQLTLIAKIK